MRASAAERGVRAEHVLLLCEERRVAGRLDKSIERASVVQRAFEDFCPRDAEDEYQVAAEHCDRAELRDGCEEGVDEHRHARHALEGAKWAQRAHLRVGWERGELCVTSQPCTEIKGRRCLGEDTEKKMARARIG